MDLKTIRLENGWTGVVEDKPAKANGAGMSGFAAELDRAARAAKQAEASGDMDLKTAYDGLSAQSQAVLSRLKAGDADITMDEWSALRMELRDAGLISRSDFAESDPGMVIVGYTDANGDAVIYPFATGCSVSYTDGSSMKSNSFLGIDWDGGPFRYFDQWLKILLGHRDDLELRALLGGTVYDTSHLTRQADAIEKVSGLVKDLLEYC